MQVKLSMLINLWQYQLTKNYTMSAKIPPHNSMAKQKPALRLVRCDASTGNVLSTLSPTILEKIAAGDRSAVGQCMDQYGDLVWSLARRFLGNSADLEDAVQEIFIEIWSNAGRYDPSIAKEVTFVATITRRRLIDRLRKNSRRPASEEYDDGLTHQNPEQTDANITSVEVGNVVKILDAMPNEQREILTLSVYEGYSHSEIANRLQMPLGTVKTRVRRGLLHIREQLEIAPPDHNVDGQERAR
jgi:RNA polymerase sigma factor (sigma-70 family)